MTVMGIAALKERGRGSLTMGKSYQWTGLVSSLNCRDVTCAWVVSRF